MHIINVSNLKKPYGTNVVLKGVDLTVYQAMVNLMNKLLSKGVPHNESIIKH